MARTREIVREIKNTDIMEVASNIKNEDDAKRLLEAVDKDYDNPEGRFVVMSNLPKQPIFDEIKVSELFKGKKEIDVLSTLSSDTEKMIYISSHPELIFDKDSDYMDYFFSKLMHSFDDERLITVLYRTYYKYFEEHNMFVNYIGSLHTDKYREQQFHILRETSNYIFALVASKFDSDEKKMSFFNTYYDYKNTTYFDVLLGSFNSDKSRLVFLEKYRTFIPFGSINIVPHTFKTNDGLLEACKEYKELFDSLYLRDTIIESKMSVNKKTQFIDVLSDTFRPDMLTDLIVSIKDDHVKMDLFEKYITIMTRKEYEKLIKHLSHKSITGFLDRHLKEIDNKLISDLIRDNYSVAKWAIENHMDILTTASFEAIENGKIGKLFNLKITDLQYGADSNRRVLNAITLRYPDKAKEMLSEIFEGEELEFIKSKLKDDPNLFKTYNFVLYKIHYFRDLELIFGQFARDKEVASYIEDMYYNKPNRLEIFMNIIVYLDSTFDINSDTIIKKVAKGITGPEFSFLDTVNPKDLSYNCLSTIIYKITKCSEPWICPKLDVPVNNLADLITYEDRLFEHIDDIYDKSHDKEEKIELFLYKLYGVNREKAKDLILHTRKAFCDRYHDSHNPINYVEDMEDILDMNDECVINREYYHKCRPLALYEKNQLTYSIDTYYDRLLKKSLLITDMDSVKILKTEMVNGQPVTFFEPLGDFMLLVNNVQKNPGERIKSYRTNYNNDVRYNHNKSKIRCSLISGENMRQTGKINNTLFGFLDFQYDDIELKDVHEETRIKNTIGFEPEMLSDNMLPNRLIDNTRGEFNTVIVNKRYANSDEQLQPAYVVLHSRSNKRLYNEALRAAAELHLGIVYLDEDKILKQYAEEIEYLKENILDTWDFNMDDFSRLVNLFFNIYVSTFGEKYYLDENNAKQEYHLNNSAEISKLYNLDSFFKFVEKLLNKIQSKYEKGKLYRWAYNDIMDEFTTILMNERSKYPDYNRQVGLIDKIVEKADNMKYNTTGSRTRSVSRYKN